MEVFADVIDAMDASEVEEALGEVVDRTISSCAEESGERAWYVRLWGRIAAADISTDENRSAVRYGHGGGTVPTSKKTHLDTLD